MKRPVLAPRTSRPIKGMRSCSRCTRRLKLGRRMASENSTTPPATMPNAAECEIFAFAQPLPCLLIKRHSYNRDAVMIEYVEGLFRGDAYRYRLNLST